MVAVRTSRLRQLNKRGAAAAITAAAMTFTGCAGPASAPPQPSVSASPSPQVNLAEAGDACLLLDSGRLQQRIGVMFEVAASAAKTKTHTCVTRPAAAALPELSLSVTATKTDAAVFKDVIRPDGAKSVSGLGRAAFFVISLKKGRPPSIEVGWLAGNARMLLLKITMPDGSDQVAAKEMAKRLIAVARDIDKRSI